MSAAFLDTDQRHCCECGQTDDLCAIGPRDYCPKHYREAIKETVVEREKVSNVDPWLIAGE